MGVGLGRGLWSAAQFFEIDEKFSKFPSFFMKYNEEGDSFTNICVVALSLFSPFLVHKQSKPHLKSALHWNCEEPRRGVGGNDSSSNESLFFPFFN